MGQLVINLTPEAEERLGKAARAHGQALPEYVCALLERQPWGASGDPAEAGETDAERDARYVQGYREQPETPEELQASLMLAAAAFAGEPWE